MSEDEIKKRKFVPEEWEDNASFTVFVDARGEMGIHMFGLGDITKPGSMKVFTENYTDDDYCLRVFRRKKS